MDTAAFRSFWQNIGVGSANAKIALQLAALQLHWFDNTKVELRLEVWETDKKRETPCCM